METHDVNRQLVYKQAMFHGYIIANQPDTQQKMDEILCW